MNSTNACSKKPNVSDAHLVSAKVNDIEVYEAGTGAVRSTDLNAMRWDLISGYALNKVAERARRGVDNYTSGEMIALAASNAYQFLGGFGSDKLVEGAYLLMLAIDEIDTTDTEKHDREKERRRILPQITEVGWANLPYRALKRLATTYNEGGLKYGDHNWLYGFRVDKLLNHAIHHCFRYLDGFREEDELGHALWGFMSSIHMFDLRPDMRTGLLSENWTLNDEIKAELQQHATRRKK